MEQVHGALRNAAVRDGYLRLDLASPRTGYLEDRLVRVGLREREALLAEFLDRADNPIGLFEDMGQRLLSRDLVHHDKAHVRVAKPLDRFLADVRERLRTLVRLIVLVDNVLMPYPVVPEDAITF